jgi:hypothetical protein
VLDLVELFLFVKVECFSHGDFIVKTASKRGL